MQIQFSTEDLKPIVMAVVADMLTRFGGAERLAYSERESAALLGLNSTQLRDARLRGELTGSKLGKSWHYTRADLLAFLESRKAGEGK